MLLCQYPTDRVLEFPIHLFGLIIMNILDNLRAIHSVTVSLVSLTGVAFISVLQVFVLLCAGSQLAFYCCYS